MKTHRKIFAVLMAIVMLITTAVPFAAFAEGTDDLIDFGSTSSEAAAADSGTADNTVEEDATGQEAEGNANSGSVEFVEEVPEDPAPENNATEQSEQQESSAPAAVEEPIATTVEEEKPVDAPADTNNALTEQEQTAPAAETNNAETPTTQETPAQNEDTTPLVPDVEPEETVQEETPVKENKEPEINLDDALTDCSVKDPDKASVESGSQVQADVRFKTTRQLDKVSLTLRYTNADLATLKISAISNAGNATYKVIKPFHIKYTDEKDNVKEENVNAICAEGRLAESASVRLDMEYRETKNAEHPEAEATFAGEYYVIFENVPAEIKAELTVKGSVVENENAVISVNGTVFVGDKDKSFSIGKATYKYEEKVEENNTENEENPDKTEKSVEPEDTVDTEKVENKTDEQSGSTEQTRSAATAKRGLAKGGTGDETRNIATTAGAYYTESSVYGHISSKPLSGVSITLTAADGSMDPVTKTTDASGIVSFGELPEGEYTATVNSWEQEELYTLGSDNSITHTNNVGHGVPGSDMTATFMFGFTRNSVDENNSSIVIFVKDNTNSTDENPVGVQGATGKIVKGVEEKTFATGENGKATIENLSAGTWSVYLLTTPEEYKDPDATTSLTEINLGINTVFTCTIPVNAKPTTGSLTFKAFDTDDEDVVLAGVVGKIKNGDSEQTFVTDADGMASITGLAFGTWELYLTETPEGYTNPDESQKLGSLELSVDTPAIGPVSLSIKKSATSGKMTVMAVFADSASEGISGITYDIYNEEGRIDTQTTNADGYAYFDNLPFGVNYTIKENNVPEELEESEGEPRQLEVEFTMPQQVKFSYHVKNHDEPTPGSETATVNVTVIEKDTENPVPGVVLELVSDDATVEKTTGEDGKAAWNEVTPGTYYVKSKTIPEAYQQVEYTSDTFTLEAGTIMNVDPIVLTPVEHEPVNPATGSIIVNVVFADGDVVTPVANASIQVSREDLDEPYTGTTNENGQYSIEDAPVGTYTVSITGMPAEYEETYDDQEAVVSEDEDATVTFTAEKKQAEEKKTGTVKITITANDSESTPVEGAAVCIEKDEESVWTGTTMADGSVVSDPLETGAYAVRINSLPDGYVNDTEPLRVTVTEDAETEASFTVGVTEPMHTLTICLKDKDTGDGIEGVALSLRMDGEDVAQEDTDENGEVTFLVPSGQYVLEVDVDTIPDGYNEPEYEGIYDLTGDDPVADTIELTGSFGTITLHAVNKTTNAPIQGVVFGIEKTEGESAAEYTTDSTGTVTVRLPAVYYTVSLASVPSEYEEIEFEKEIALEEGETSEDTVSLYSNDTPDDGKISIQVINAETGDPVEGAAFIVRSDDPEDEGTEYLAMDDGKVSVVKTPGTYTVTLSDIPSTFEQVEYEKTFTVERGILIEDTVRLVPKTDVEPETLEILEFTGLSFNPEEQSVVPTSDFTIGLENYSLKLNKASVTADQVRFEIKPVTKDMRMVASFSGTASGYKVVAIQPIGDSSVAETVASISASGNGVCAVSFDSKNIPMKDPETGEIDPEIEGSFPENTESVWLYVYNPSADFAVSEFTLSGPTDASLDEIDFTATTDVTVGTLPKQTEENTGKITKGDPAGTLTITGTASRLNTGDDMGYNVSFVNESNTVYATITMDVCVDEIFAPEKLNPGVWDGYEGNIEVQSINTSGQATTLCVIDASTTNTILLTSEPIQAIRFITKSEVAGNINVEGITLSGSFNAGGNAKAHAEFAGSVSDDLVWTMQSDEITTEVVEIPEPVTTGTITITVKDNNNAPVPGVKFAVGELSEIETDGTGNATVEVDAGTYNVKMTYVPDKYENVDYNRNFEVTGGSAQTDAVVLSLKPVVTPVPKGTLEVTVIEETTGTEQIPVAGVEVSLYKKTDGSESVRVGTGTTNENGVIIDTLEEGTYVIKVTSVPDAYETSAYEKEVIVSAATPVKEIVVLKKTAAPTPTPTPTPTPDSGDDPVPPGPGENSGGNPTPTPTPEPDPLSVDSPKITANTSSVAYGEDALFYVRGLNAGGMDPTDYYVLHLMIPSGIQVKTISFPGFGTDTRVTLTYDSGTTELGTYRSGETVNLTERQGTNLRYIAFQIHGVEKVTADGDVQLLVKNISARDRIVTLQAILSIRDSKTAVKTLDDGKKAQNSDRYNISIAGPKNDNNSSENKNESMAGQATGEKDNEPEKPVTIEDRVVTVYPQLVYVDPEENVAVKVLDVEKNDPAPKPLILPNGNAPAEVLSIATTSIADQPVTDELILARMKQKTLALTRLFHEKNKFTVKSIIK